MRIILLLLSVSLFVSCNTGDKSTLDDIINADKEFSAASEKLGFNKAFIMYAHEDAVILRDNSFPLVGSEIKSYFEKVDPDGIHFSWNPTAGDIAKSGEMGYTYGTYLVESDSGVERGTYVSIWKKDNEGNWKYVLDSGNEGLGDK